MSTDNLQTVTRQATVRSFAPTDQEGVQRLYDDGLLAGQLAPNDTGADIDNIPQAYFDDPRHHFWVVECEGELVGMIGVGSDEEHTAEIRRLRVLPKYQSTCIAAKLLETALNHCKQHNYLKIRLDTRFEKTEALEQFERLGFQHTRTRDAPGKEMLEFYLDIYRQHEDENGNHNVA